ncbi:MAG: helix-turn-helix transcriptional regulator [Halanaerobium sp.]|nr:helix-turn-helix transcriptional regulator [Halanaerobium sp.]
MTFGQRLKEMRKESRMTQAELAGKVGVSRATVAGYETKGKEPPYDTLIQLAKALGCSTDYLLGYSSLRRPEGEIREPKENVYLDRLYRVLAEREELQVLLQEASNLSTDTLKKVIEIVRILRKG